MRKITFLKTLLLAIVMMVGSASASAQATLPFSYDSGKPTATTGLTHTGLGTDYASSPKMKFDTSADNLILNFTGVPGTLSFSIKWNQSTAATRFPGDFTLQQSADGTSYTTVQLYNTTTGSALANGTIVTETISTLLSTTRYLKWVYTAKTNGNIAIGAITLAAGSAATAVSTPTITPSGSLRTTDNYWNTADIALASATADATIYYTTNGVDPTIASTLYSAPFSVTTTTTVKALAVKAGLDNSAVASKTITISTPPVATIPYSEAFSNTLGDWTSYSLAGTKPVLAQATGAYFNGFGGGSVDTWFVSPKFTATASGLALNFNYASQYIGNGLVIKYSTDYAGFGSPATATWTDLTTLAAPLVQDINYTVKASGDITTSVSGTTYFALVYTAASGYSDWRITNLTVATASAPCTASGIAFASPTVNKLLSDAAFTLTPTTSSTGAITYSSATPAVATVDASTGLVTLLTAGSTVITATQVADATYCANTATYTLNVAPTTPTITVTENTIADFAANVGSTNQKTANVSGINLTAGITLALSGTNAGLFSLSEYSVAQSGGTAANTVVTITYTPTSSGTHTATLTLSSTGATDVTRTLTATAGLDTPVATLPSGANNSVFTANWDAVPGATEYQLNVYTKVGGAASATDLFISEYVEGLSNNKAIEIFNGTGAPVDLSVYSIKKQVNGAGAYGNELVLTGTLANNDVYVIANSSASALIQAVTDLSSTSSALTFNGNDAVALFKNGTQIDEVGVFNQVANWGADVTLIRKSSIISPKATYDAADWDSQALDYITNLGAHTMSGAGLVNTPIVGSPFTVTGATSKQFTGLEGGTTYYYTVIAKDGSVTTPASNEMAASTLTTAIDQTNSVLSISAVNGKIVLRAVAGETINVYNAIGQKILSKSSIDGLNTFAVAAHGVVMVKVGNRVGKVIL